MPSINERFLCLFMYAHGNIEKSETVDLLFNVTNVKFYLVFILNIGSM